MAQCLSEPTRGRCKLTRRKSAKAAKAAAEPGNTSARNVEAHAPPSESPQQPQSSNKRDAPVWISLTLIGGIAVRVAMGVPRSGAARPESQSEDRGSSASDSFSRSTVGGDNTQTSGERDRRAWYMSLPVVYALLSSNEAGSSALLEMDLDPSEHSSDSHAVAFESRDEAQRAAMLLQSYLNRSIGIQACSPNATEQKAHSSSLKLAVCGAGEVVPQPSWTIDELANSVSEVAAPSNMLAFFERQLQGQDSPEPD